MFLRRKLHFLSEKQGFFVTLITYNYTILRPHKLIAGSNRPEFEKVLRRYSSPEVAVDSINRKYGKFDLSGLHYKEDIRTVDSAYLCRNIEWASGYGMNSIGAGI